MLYPVLDGVIISFCRRSLAIAKIWSWVLECQILVLGSALIGEEARSIGGNLPVIPTLEKNPVSLG